MIRFSDVVNVITNIVYLSGVVVILIGFLKALYNFIQSERKSHIRLEIEQEHIRLLLGSYILLGLDFIIIADIISSIFRIELIQLYSLAIIVAIRIVISYFLEKELGHLKDKIM